MISFESDYINGAHPAILDALLATNDAALTGYGSDHYSQRAKEKIRTAIGMPEAEIAFLTGGTQTNKVVIASMLRDWEGVICARTAHINTHEAGAIEYTGHKVIEIDEHCGKIDPAELEDTIDTFFADENNDHMVYPGMVYLSFPTEYGTIYSKAELQSIYCICEKNNIPLYIDGARLGYGLTCRECDLSICELAELCDVFYIGGTKVGALCGDALVFTKHNMPQRFLSAIKRHGALVAKGRLLGVQFDALFTDDLYFGISRHANKCAEKMKELFLKYGFQFYIDSPTNQQFVILTDEQSEELKKEVRFSFWERLESGRLRHQSQICPTAHRPHRTL